MRFARSVTVMLGVASAACATSTTAAAADDAWPLYQRAGARIDEGDRLGKSSPSASNVAFEGRPPYSPEWEWMEKAAYEFNGPALADVHRAAALTAAAWPVGRPGDGAPPTYLDALRNIANQVADAAVYEHVHGDDAAAVDRVRDLWHIADLLDGAGDGPAVHALVAMGLRAVAMDRLLIVNSDLHVAERPAAGDKAVPAAGVEALIRRLFDNGADPAAAADKLVGRERVRYPDAFANAGASDRLTRQFQRDQTERNLAAMALACRLYYARNARWPTSLDEFAALLPARPADAAGPMGYALVKGGLPGGGDRPLVYSLAGVPAGVRPAYPTAEPKFSFYVNGVPGKKIPPGQFRDATLWPGKPDAGERMPLKALD